MPPDERVTKALGEAERAMAEANRAIDDARRKGRGDLRAPVRETLPDPTRGLPDLPKIPAFDPLGRRAVATVSAAPAAAATNPPAVAATAGSTTTTAAPATATAGGPAMAPALTDHIPDEYLYTPSLDLAVWLDIWERDLRFQVHSHRGVLGRFVVWLKRGLAPLWRAPLSADFQRQRIAHIVLLRRLELFTDELRRSLNGMREPYEFVRDRAVPDLIARSDAVYGILDRRIDALEAELRKLREEAALARKR